MALISISPILESLFQYARSLEGAEGNKFSAHAFLLAVCDYLNGDFKIEGDDGSLKETLTAALAARNTTPRELKAHLVANTGANDDDEFYIEDRTKEAKFVAMSRKTSEVTADIFLECVLNKPPQFLAGVATKKSEATTSMDPEKTDKQNADMQTADKPITPFRSERMPEEEETAAARPNAETGDPKERIEALTQKVKEVREKLRQAVKGQDHAISVFMNGYFQAEMLSITNKEHERPRATFLFAGPPGVGKTFLSKTATSKELLNLPHIVFDMSEYSNHESAIEFIGSDAVYQNSKQGNFTSYVAKHPKSVIIFDEIEKAHISIIHLFLQILDSGRIRDSKTDTEISLADTILIFTTNAGRQIYEASDSGDFSSLSNKIILNAIKKETNPQTGEPFFPAAICSRFASGNVVMFNHLSANALLQIAKKEVEASAKEYKEKIGIDIQVQDAVYSTILFAEGGAADGRTIRSRSAGFLDTELLELMRLVSPERTGHSVKELEKINVCVDIPQDDPAIRALFIPDTKPSVLVFAGEENAHLCHQYAQGYDVFSVQTVEAAKWALQKYDIKAVLLDIGFGKNAGKDYLNIEDVDSVARDFFWTVKTQFCDMPVYLLQTDETDLQDEELVSFSRLGVRGTVNLKDQAEYTATLQQLCEGIHQQNSIKYLARANKVLTYETAQLLSEDGKSAEIRLFDFELLTAVDAEDSKNILSSMSRPTVRFTDVIGAEDAKKELRYFVDYMKNPKKYLASGVKAPKGVLLYGPPGTGKTMLAKAMAYESDVTFIATAGNEFLQKYVGEGKDKVNELFRTARKYAPAIIFVDEIDAIAKERQGGKAAAGNGEDVLTAFLAQMDGFNSDPTKPVFVLAATNFDVKPGSDKSLDAALLRRFDRQIYVDLPNREERLRYLVMRLRANPMYKISEECQNNIALRSAGMSLAVLEGICELALRMAVQDNKEAVTDDMLAEAFEKRDNGEAKQWNAETLLNTARHEAGHAYICWHYGDTPAYATIVSRGNYGGYIQHGDDEKKFGYNRQDILNRIRCSLGGRAAEIVYYGPEAGISTGPSSDLQHATKLAEYMLCYYGMDEDFGLAVVNNPDGEMAKEIRTRVNALLKEQLDLAIQEISEARDKMDKLVEALMDKNHLSGAEIDAILRDNE